MAVSTKVCTSWINESAGGTHTSADTYKIALIKVGAGGTYGAGTTNYSDLTGGSDEVANGLGYTTGGATLSGFNATGGVITFTDAAFATATFAAIGFIIYNSTRANKSVMVGSFGGTYTGGGGTYTVPLSSALMTGTAT